MLAVATKVTQYMTRSLKLKHVDLSDVKRRGSVLPRDSLEAVFRCLGLGLGLGLGSHCLGLVSVLGV